MLFWHKHDLSRASMDLANFTPFPDEWTVEDKVLFEQAFQFHGKSFHRIRQMVCIINILQHVVIFLKLVILINWSKRHFCLTFFIFFIVKARLDIYDLSFLIILFLHVFREMIRVFIISLAMIIIFCRRNILSTFHYKYYKPVKYCPFL